jgi:hypothetical protein
MQAEGKLTDAEALKKAKKFFKEKPKNEGYFWAVQKTLFAPLKKFYTYEDVEKYLKSEA